MGRREVWIDLEGLRQLLFSLLELAALQENQSQEVRRIELLGIGKKDRTIDLLGVVEPALLVERNGSAVLGLQHQRGLGRSLTSGRGALRKPAFAHHSP